MVRESKGEQTYSTVRRWWKDGEEVRERGEGRKRGNSFHLFTYRPCGISGITFYSCPVMNGSMCGNKRYAFIALKRRYDDLKGPCWAECVHIVCMCFRSYPGNGEGQVEVLSSLQPEAPGSRSHESDAVVAGHFLLDGYSLLMLVASDDCDSTENTVEIGDNNESFDDDQMVLFTMLFPNLWEDMKDKHIIALLLYVMDMTKEVTEML